ncbi:MAG: DUF6531 domain-containing protein, partial [Candidatus Odinarchaeota archaeon]
MFKSIMGNCIGFIFTAVFFIFAHVSANADGLSVIPSDVSIKPGDTIQLNVDGGCPPYTYTSNNTNAFSVNANGLVTGRPDCEEQYGETCFDSLYFRRPSGEEQEVCLWPEDPLPAKLRLWWDDTELWSTVVSPTTVPFVKKEKFIYEWGWGHWATVPCADYVVPVLSEPPHYGGNAFGWWFNGGRRGTGPGKNTMMGYYPNGSISIGDGCGNSAEVPGKNVGKDADGGQPVDSTNGDPPCKDCKTCPVQKVGGPINVTTGNMLYSAPSDVLVKGRSLSIDFRRTYNSRDNADDHFGFGWSTLAQIRLVDDGYFVNIRGEDGRAHYFAKLSDGTYRPMYDNHGRMEGDDQTGYTWDSDDLQYEFLSDGRLAQITSPTGDSMIYSYDAATQLVKRITLQNGRGIELAYNLNDRLEYIYLLDESGSPSSLPARAFSYQEMGLNYLTTKIRDGSGQLIERYIYNDTKISRTGGTVYRNSPPNLTEVRRYYDAVNYSVVETHEYDEEDRAVTSAEGDGYGSRSLDYSVEGQTMVTDSLGRQQVFTHEGPWRVTSVTGTGCSECGSDFESFVYDYYGNVISAVDFKGYSTSITRDSHGNVLTRTEAVGTTDERTTVYEYHPDYDLVT